LKSVVAPLPDKASSRSDRKLVWHLQAGGPIYRVCPQRTAQISSIQHRSHGFSANLMDSEQI